MTTTDPRSRQLSDMAECAYRLGMAFGAAAETAQGTDRWLEYFNAFDRCFFAVRVATALQLRLNRTPAEPREAATDREALIDRADPPETPDSETPESETDGRDRDRGDRQERRHFSAFAWATAGSEHHQQEDGGRTRDVRCAQTAHTVGQGNGQRSRPRKRCERGDQQGDGEPAQPGLLADLDNGHYFPAS